MPTIGVLTAGGDCPGLNAVIRAVVARAIAGGASVLGIRNGWQGLMEPGLTVPLDRDAVRGIVMRGGTILGSSRMDPYVHGNGMDSLRPVLDETGIEGVVAIGGDGTLRTAARLAGEGLAVVGVPKTIDNDIGATDVSFGFETAVQIVTDAIDRLTTTAESHNRIMVVEVMGRHAGWIALHAGIAGGAEAILIPEVHSDIEDLGRRITERHESGSNYSVVVVAEGVPAPGGAHVIAGTDATGFERLGGVGLSIGAELERVTGYETRVTTLGHLQRGGSPTAFDRVLGTRFGLRAAELALTGESNVMVALRGMEITVVDMAAACAEPRPVPAFRAAEAAWFTV